MHIVSYFGEHDKAAFFMKISFILNWRRASSKAHEVNYSVLNRLDSQYNEIILRLERLKQEDTIIPWKWMIMKSKIDIFFVFAKNISKHHFVNRVYNCWISLTIVLQNLQLISLNIKKLYVWYSKHNNRFNVFKKIIINLIG